MRFTPVRIGWIGLLLVAGTAPAPAQTTLRYKFKEGEKLHYVLEQKMTMKMKVQDQDLTMEMVQTFDQSWNITSVDKDGNATMTQKFDRVRFKMDNPLGKIDYDSKDGKLPEGQLGELLGPLFKALTGLEVGLTMDPRGEVKNLKIPENFLKTLKNMPGAAAFQGMFSEEGLKQMMSQGGLILPKQPVNKDDTWETKTTVKLPFGKVNTIIVYKYEGPTTRDGKKLEQIGVKLQTKLEDDPKTAVSMKLKEDDSKGTSYFDNAAGRLVETRLVSSMAMEVTAGGQTLTQKIEQTVTLKLQGQGE
ncbi:MAG TPA: DUF6263 family protein [Gemmataceae bacterium]|nr:DUF6263 family protein [Gemmataceae bacterium]